MNSSHTKIKQVGLLLTAASLLFAAKPAEALTGDIGSFTPSEFTQDSGTVTSVTSNNNINQASTTGGAGFGGYFTSEFLLLGAQNSDTTIPLDNQGTINNSRNDSIALSPSFPITQSIINNRTSIRVEFNYAFNGNNSASAFDNFEVQLYDGSNLVDASPVYSISAPAGYGSGTGKAIFPTSSLLADTNYQLQLTVNESTSTGSSAAGFNQITVTSVPFEFSPAQGLLAVGGIWGISAYLKRKKAAATLSNDISLS
jgi:hypothetical protein